MCIIGNHDRAMGKAKNGTTQVPMKSYDLIIPRFWRKKSGPAGLTREKTIV
jgi:hypothetical protein